MKYMTSMEIRNMWLKFFEDKKHHILESASLVPVNDPTLLWINAGVAPLKKYFDGSETPVSKRLTNVQKCIRTNDIENVGKTARHHTFFEMLGNFSIGDYFKEEAIEFAYELLTSEKYFNFPIEKLYFTYYPTDIEAKEKWLELGIKENHIIPVEGNFWEIGEGPCGPNTEIFFDRGEEYDSRGPILIEKDLENDRYIEIWNIVFSQYNAKTNLDRSDYPELPNKNIDTGAGLERFACVIQNTKTNFETDLFLPIIKEIEKLSGVKYNGQMEFKVIADHIKTLVFSISDGAMLSNEGRGYVLRRLLRRAVKYGRNLGFEKPFLHLLIDSVIETMSDFYPDIIESKTIVEKILIREEEQFLLTISDGEKHLFDAIKKEGKQLSGKTAFMLYDTYGFPIELTIEYASEKGVTVDEVGFREELEKQKERSRNARENISSMNHQEEEYLNFYEESLFVGYNKLEVETKVIKVFDEGIVLKETPFYATSGGQVADIGIINDIEVKDVKKLPHGQNLHVLDSKNFKIGDIVTAKVLFDNRKDITKNHSATHLLHQALKDVLGNHVAQQGSQVTKETLRFDFNHYENISDEDILKVENIVNEKIKEALNVDIKEINIEDAKKLGAQALFGEKYGDVVRVVNMDYSIELCGGTHVANTKDIEKFAILSIESIGSGIYRILASTSNNISKELDITLTNVKSDINDLNEKGLSLSSDFRKTEIGKYKLSYQDIIEVREKLANLRKDVHSLEKKIELEKTKNVLQNADQFIPENATSKLIVKTENIETSILKQLVDVIYDKINGETLLLCNIKDGKASFIAKTNGETHAGNVIKKLAKLVNGNGGGRDTLAQGGTQDLELIDEALEKIKEDL